MLIRQSRQSDRSAINDVLKSAFTAGEGPELVELVDGLLDDATALPLLSLVAESDGDLIGYILFTCVSIDRDPGIAAHILAPLAVSPHHQGEGVGGALIRAGLEQLTEAPSRLVFVLGHPGYYPRFGFHPAGTLGYEAPYPIPGEHADAWMVQELVPGVIGKVRGRVQCAQSLHQEHYWRE